MPRMLVYCVLILALWCGRPVLAEVDASVMETTRELAWECGYEQRFLDAVEMGDVSPDHKQRFLDFAIRLCASSEQKQVLSKDYERGYESGIKELDDSRFGYTKEEWDFYEDDLLEFAKVHDIICSGKIIVPWIDILNYLGKQ